ncbi:MAG TPA: TRAP transporter substrate-binding protein DctP [Gammaproteobacteria bacterium]|jgi:TRAP-type C4-dicarboxylate transport system substrate-binding protein|nr:C4-dicarboxylate ABC transporter [Chromatiales bacterium]MCP4924724.1 C4-dicarboxylate ABC transporter [Gammaproteobacteria bacterium]HJP38511.1 TRAP transporter substrate-binding protein DctP [Gammaproteobacteria bacterium]
MRFHLGLISAVLFLMLSCMPISEAQETTFKIATIAPEGSQWMVDLKAAGKEIATRTAGRVKLKLYGGGIMGADKKVLRKIRIGQLQGGAFVTIGLAERYRDIVLYGLPMAFQTQAEVDYVRERMDPVLIKGLEEAGYVSFGFAGGGFARLMGAEPITDISALQGRKVWVPEGDPISYKAMESMQLSPVVLPITDVLTGLQTGLLEFVASPPVAAVVMQWYTKVKYVTTQPFAYTAGLLVIDKRAFSRISETDQLIVREILTSVYALFEQRNRRDNREAEAALRSNGLQFVGVDPLLVPSWRETTAVSNRKMAEKGVFSLELLDELLGHIADFHASAGADQAALNSTE